VSDAIVGDLFCGAGGESEGVKQACEQIGRKLKLVAVNHWERAIETHAANHPRAEHHCEDLTTMNPRKAVPGGKLHLLVASPECTHHSVARGGMPVNDQSRASAWCVLRWATALRVDRILIENVPEFETWGPIGATGRPLKSRKGETFVAFVKGLESLGYRVAWRVLNAADYGGATTRRRLFIQAALGKRPIRWPEPTHEPNPTEGLYGLRQKWRAAREVIDWSIAGTSIFNRKRPLSPNTMKRIEAGIRKFCGKMAEPFLVMLRRNGEGRSLDLPVPTLTAGGEHVALCEPFVMGMSQTGSNGNRMRSAGRPFSTITTADDFGLVSPFLVTACHGTPEGQAGRRTHSLDDPAPTLATSKSLGICEPFIVPTNYGERTGQSPRSHSVDRPYPTVTAGGVGHALVEPFIVPQFSGNGPRSVDGPAPTITTTSRGVGLCEPFLVPFYANGQADSTAEPLRTVTTKDRHGLCEPDALQLDIRFRMLQPHELAAAMGFPSGYRITGNRSEQVRQIGNAVEVCTAKSLALAMLEAN
jgi:DNA (cytosine-5)-methyltransferase 1